MNSKKKENDFKYECGLCDETFSVKKNLGSHIATHTNPNGQNTKQNSAKVTNGEVSKKPKKVNETKNQNRLCEICEKSFLDCEILKRHILDMFT